MYKDRTALACNGTSKVRAERRTQHPQMNLFAWGAEQGVLLMPVEPCSSAAGGDDTPGGRAAAAAGH